MEDKQEMWGLGSVDLFTVKVGIIYPLPFHPKNKINMKKNGW